MRIWLFTRPRDRVWWECFDGFCVVAATEDRARDMTNEHAKHHKEFDWLKAADITVRCVGEATIDAKEEILLASNVGNEGYS